jgi:hypothetical protein
MTQGRQKNSEAIVVLVQERLASKDGKQLIAAAARELEQYRAELDKRIRIDPHSVLDRITL